MKKLIRPLVSLTLIALCFTQSTTVYTAAPLAAAARFAVKPLLTKTAKVLAVFGAGAAATSYEPIRKTLAEAGVSSVGSNNGVLFDENGVRLLGDTSFIKSAKEGIATGLTMSWNGFIYGLNTFASTNKNFFAWGVQNPVKSLVISAATLYCIGGLFYKWQQAKDRYIALRDANPNNAIGVIQGANRGLWYALGSRLFYPID